MHSTSKMKALWFSAVLTLIAESISETCDITLDDNRDSSITQFCLSSLLERRFSTKGKSQLNFTLNGSVLVFTPLPENRQVEIKVAT